MSFANCKFLGNDVLICSPKTAAEVLEYLHKILPCEDFVFTASNWANKYCLDHDIMNSINTHLEPDEVMPALVKLCHEIVTAAKAPQATTDGLGLIYSRQYNEPSNDRTKKELGPIFEGVSIQSLDFAGLVSVVSEFGPQILQVPYWVFEGLYIKFKHDTKRERAHQQKASDIAETKRINAEVFG